MFRTELTIAPAAGQLPRTARVLTMGSCFADSIGARLAAYKVETRVNPFGTVFQPLALARLLRAAAGEDVDWQQHLVQARGRWQSYDLHGSIGADSPVELLQYIQEAVRQTGEFLQHADVLLLTLGTAWAYRLRETGELVSNCHKQSADLFVRELLTPDEIINALAETHAYLRRINPELRFVLTVSPVRHLKDTLPLNAVSKSVLRVATHILSDLLPGVAYFPAFELLTDDLRDYRFYAADMLHPSEVAEDYIWDKFARTYFDAEFGRFRKEWAAVRQALGHRPLHEGAPEHRQFLENTRTQLEQLALRQVDVADELRTVHARIAALPLPYQPQPVAELEDGEERIDIGDEAPAVVVKAAATAAQSGSGEGRPARLSPEEFRAQRAARPARPERGRRDGRGKGQAAQPSEIEEFQAANFAQADAFAPAPLLTTHHNTELTPVASAPEATPGAPATPLEMEGTEASPKKKRRSRGGAKRTARKNALREATEMGLDEGQLAASMAALEAAAATLTGGEQLPATGERPTGREPREPQDSRESRNNRRRDGGRGTARVPLFATPEASDAATDLGAVPAAAITQASANTGDEGAGTDSAGPGSSARKSRNRKKKKGNRAGAPESDSSAAAGAAATAEPAQPQPRGTEIVVTDNADALARNDNRRDNNRRDGRNGRDNGRRQPALPVRETGAVATTPVVFVSAASGAAAQSTTPPVAATSVAGSAQSTSPAPSSAQKPSKRKSRAMVGGRAEKPAFDTPIIPVADSSAPLTQVAAGRLTGTSASLVEPTAAAKPRNAVAGKPAASNAKGVKPGAGKAAAQPAAATTAVSAVPSVSAAKPVAAPAAPSPAAPAGKGAKATQAAKAKPAAVQAAATVAAAPKPAARPAPAAPKPAGQPLAAASGAPGAKAANATGAASGKKAQQQPVAAGKPAPAAKAAAATAAPTKPAALPSASATKTAAPAKPAAKPAVKATATAPTKSVTKPAATTPGTAAASKAAAKPAPASPAKGGAKAPVAKAAPAAVQKPTAATKAAIAKPAAAKTAKAAAPATRNAPVAAQGAKATSAVAKPAAKAPAKAIAKPAPAAAAAAKPAGKAKATKK